MSTVHRHQSNISYKIMAAYLRFRERSRRPTALLQRLGVDRGHSVLDFGCGIGSYSIPAAHIVGPEGHVYALDIHPVAIAQVRKRVKNENLKNVSTIQSGLETGLDSLSLDFVFLFDVFTWISNKEELISELYRVLKKSGVFAVIIDHIEPSEFTKVIERTDLFTIDSQEENLFILSKA